jgi:hypothetical protein
VHRAASIDRLGHPLALRRSAGQAATPRHFGLGLSPAQHYAQGLKSFSFILNSQIVSKFRKSIGIRRNVKKW